MSAAAPPFADDDRNTGLDLEEFFSLIFSKKILNLKSSSLESVSELAGSSNSLERETLGTELELSLRRQNQVYIKCKQITYIAKNEIFIFEQFSANPPVCEQMRAWNPQIITEASIIVSQVSKSIAEVKLKGGVRVQRRIVASLCISSSPDNHNCY